jgi:hypothetical protein
MMQIIIYIYIYIMADYKHQCQKTDARQDQAQEEEKAKKERLVYAGREEELDEISRETDEEWDSQRREMARFKAAEAVAAAAAKVEEERLGAIDEKIARLPGEPQEALTRESYIRLYKYLGTATMPQEADVWRRPEVYLAQHRREIYGEGFVLERHSTRNRLAKGDEGLVRIAPYMGGDGEQTPEYLAAIASTKGKIDEAIDPAERYVFLPERELLAKRAALADVI